MSSITNTYYTPLIPAKGYPVDHPIRRDIQNLIDIVLKCPMIEELAQKWYVEGDSLHGKKGPLEVQYNPSVTKTGFIDHTNRWIVLGTLDTIKSLDILIFEISNASQTHLYRKIQSQIRTMTSDTYAKEVERIEYTSKKSHHKIVQWGIEYLQWSSSLDTYKDSAKENFEKSWHQEIRFSMHAQFYRKQYASITNTRETKPGLKEKLESSMWLLIFKIVDICVVFAIFKRNIRFRADV